MGKPSPQYRDDPDAVSLHTTPDDYDYAGPSDLPSYADSEAVAAATPNGHQDTSRAHRVAQLEDTYAIISPAGSNGWRVTSGDRPVNCGEVTIRMDERLAQPDSLHAYIMDYLRVMPPRPAVRIHGWHTETVTRKDKKEKERVCDFDVMLSFQAYLGSAFEPEWWSERLAEDSQKVHRGSWRATQAPGHKQGVQLTDEPAKTLQDWCQEYCASPSKLKVFRINRLVTGMNTEMLAGQIENLVRSTHYRGHLNISFPVEQKTVDIYYPHLINRWRNTWVRFIFYFTFLWLFTWPILYFLTKWWDVYTVEWKFSRSAADGRGKRYVSVSEQAWFDKHRDLIVEQVVNKCRGDATMHPTARSELEGRRQSGATTGNANVDSAVNLLQGGLRAWNAISNGRDVNDRGWGYDN